MVIFAQMVDLPYAPLAWVSQPAITYSRHNQGSSLFFGLAASLFNCDKFPTFVGIPLVVPPPDLVARPLIGGSPTPLKKWNKPTGSAQSLRLYLLTALCIFCRYLKGYVKPLDLEVTLSSWLKSRAWNSLISFLDKYSIIVAAVAIYGYYLLTSVDLLQNPTAKRGILDYILQFDSLIFMWIIAVVVIQLQKYRRERRAEEEHRKKIESEFERQRIHLQVLDEITALLQDNVNNPLAIISITTHTIRRKFEGDEEILGWLDRIDASMQRIHNTINDVKAYQTQKILQDSNRLQPQREHIEA